jgi:hypothetical protein
LIKAFYTHTDLSKAVLNKTKKEKNMPSVIDEINSAFRNKQFAGASLDEGTLVIEFQGDPEDLNAQGPTITVVEVDEGDISFNLPN